MTENPNTALMTRSDASPVSFAEMEKMALTLAKSKLFPSCSTPENALSLMLLCQAEGLHPAQAVRRFHVINGAATMRSDAMLAEFMARGGEVEWHDFNDQVCSATFSKGKSRIKYAYTMDMARKAQLVKPNGNWDKHPAAMLRARVISNAIRMVDPGIVCGIYTPEEVNDQNEAAREPVAQPRPVVAQVEPVPQADQTLAEAITGSVTDAVIVPAEAEPVEPVVAEPMVEPPAQLDAANLQAQIAAEFDRLKYNGAKRVLSFKNLAAQFRAPSDYAPIEKTTDVTVLTSVLNALKAVK